MGDTALVTEAGEYHGWAGGGCTRETVVREAQRAISSGEPRFLCLSPDAASTPRPGMLAVPMTCDSGGTVEIYVEPVLPASRLVLFGDTPAVAALGRHEQPLGLSAEHLGGGFEEHPGVRHQARERDPGVGEAFLASEQAGDLVRAGEALRVVEGVPHIVYHRSAGGDCPLAVFLPGGGHLARVAYGHPGSEPRDFIRICESIGCPRRAR